MAGHGAGSRGQELPKKGTRFLHDGATSAAHPSALWLPKLAAERFSRRVTRGAQLVSLSIPVAVDSCAPPGIAALREHRVGLAGCDMGACSILPRIIGQGRAGELLYFGRSMSGEEGERWGFFNGLSAAPLEDAMKAATRIANGPTFANGITKTQLHQQWNMSVDQAIECEAQAQAICMQTEDFRRAYNAFVEKQQPVFEGD